MGSLDSILSINFGFYQRGKVKQHWSFNKRYCHFDCSFIMPTWHPFLHHFTIVFQLQEIIKAIYAADAANGSFYYKSVFHPGGLKAMPDPHSHHSKRVALFSGETVTHAKFWIRRTQHPPDTVGYRRSLAPFNMGKCFEKNKCSWLKISFTSPIQLYIYLRDSLTNSQPWIQSLPAERVTHCYQSCKHAQSCLELGDYSHVDEEQEPEGFTNH